VLPSDHPLASRDAIVPQDLVGETFINVSGTAPTLRVVIDAYLKQSGIDITQLMKSIIWRWPCLWCVNAGRRSFTKPTHRIFALVCREPTIKGERDHRPGDWPP